MKVAIQRVDRASVQVNGKTIAAIGRGVLVLVGFLATVYEKVGRDARARLQPDRALD